MVTIGNVIDDFGRAEPVEGFEGGKQRETKRRWVFMSAFVGSCLRISRPVRTFINFISDTDVYLRQYVRLFIHVG